MICKKCNKACNNLRESIHGRGTLVMCPDCKGMSYDL